MGGSRQERIRMVRNALGWEGPVRNVSGRSGTHQDGQERIRMEGSCQDLSGRSGRSGGLQDLDTPTKC
jgi:hypothetical protein